MRVHELILECSKSLHTAFELFTSKTDDAEMSNQLRVVATTIEAVLTDPSHSVGPKLEKILVAAKKGLDRAIMEGPREYFEDASELKSLAVTFAFVAGTRREFEIIETDFAHAYDMLHRSIPDVLEEITAEEVASEEILDYEVEETLANGAKYNLLIHSLEDARLKQSYYYVKEDEEDRLNAKVVNDVVLVVRYEKAISQDVDLSMNIIFPEKLGQKVIYGVDVSPGAKNFFVFRYRKEQVEGKTRYRLHVIEFGHHVWNLGEVSGGIMKPVDFPVPDVIDNDGFGFEVPFLTNAGEESHFSFHEDIRHTAPRVAFRKRIDEGQ